jgi:hypothetical protein
VCTYKHTSHHNPSLLQRQRPQVALAIGCHQCLAALPPRHCTDEGRGLLDLVVVGLGAGLVGEAATNAGGVDVLEVNEDLCVLHVCIHM